MSFQIYRSVQHALNIECTSIPSLSGLFVCLIIYANSAYVVSGWAFVWFLQAPTTNILVLRLLWVAQHKPHFQWKGRATCIPLPEWPHFCSLRHYLKCPISGTKTTINALRVEHQEDPSTSSMAKTALHGQSINIEVVHKTRRFSQTEKRNTPSYNRCSVL